MSDGSPIKAARIRELNDQLRRKAVGGRIVITRGDSGHNQFNFSEVIGSGAAASIGTYCYYSRSDRNASNVMTVWGTQLGIDTFVTVLKEFWPDIRRKLHGSK